jgi:ferredoxin
MAVLITDLCITCGSCIDECPVNAIVDENDNPTGEDIFYVYDNKCVECVGFNEVPACANACPTDSCIVWSETVNSSIYRNDISIEKRNNKNSII